MTGIPLRIAESTGRYARSLRRYHSGDHTACPVTGYHNASNIIGEAADPAESAGDNWPHDDGRWPQTCACGYAFTAGDQWQRKDSEIYRLPDGAEFAFSRSLGTTQAATGGGCWTVTGIPPDITASPSIWHNSPHGWHGWIRNGELVQA